jgi:hypothetical protein
MSDFSPRQVREMSRLVDLACDFAPTPDQTARLAAAKAVARCYRSGEHDRDEIIRLARGAARSADGLPVDYVTARLASD